MKVCVDIQSAMAQRAGVGRYTRELIRNLGSQAGDDEIGAFYFDFKHRGHLLDMPRVTARSARWIPGRAVQRAWRLLNWPPFDWFAGPADVYHFPNFVLPPLSRGKCVVTIHDMSFARFPQFADERNLRFLNSRIRDTIERADAIITDSRFSANEIHALLDVERERLFPIHLGIEKTFHRPDRPAIDATLKTLGIDRPYLLSVGTLEPRKIFPFLIEVFEKLAPGFDGYLVIAGMPGWKYEPILERMRTSSHASRIRWLRFVDDAQLAPLYAGAELFLFTSVYEGFGFPPLEAMACGTPVLSTAHGSLKEVLGQSGTLMESFDSDLWAEKIRIILSDTDCRRMMSDYGLKQAAKYSWEETARQTWAVYRKVGG